MLISIKNLVGNVSKDKNILCFLQLGYFFELCNSLGRNEKKGMRLRFESGILI